MVYIGSQEIFEKSSEVIPDLFKIVDKNYLPDKRYTMAQESTEARLSLRKLPFKIAAIEAHEKFKFNYYSKNKNRLYIFCA